MELRTCIIHVLRALEDFHAKNFCHRDVRWPNVVYDDVGGCWKLIDFEIADKDGSPLPNDISSEHVPPENLLKPRSMYTTKGDVYAVGKLVNEFMREKMNEIVPGNMADFISESMHIKPSKRPSVTNLLKHPWLAVDESDDTLARGRGKRARQN